MNTGVMCSDGTQYTKYDLSASGVAGGSRAALFVGRCRLPRAVSLIAKARGVANVVSTNERG